MSNIILVIATLIPQKEIKDKSRKTYLKSTTRLRRNKESPSWESTPTSKEIRYFKRRLSRKKLSQTPRVSVKSMFQYTRKFINNRSLHMNVSKIMCRGFQSTLTPRQTHLSPHTGIRWPTILNQDIYKFSSLTKLNSLHRRYRPWGRNRNWSRRYSEQLRK